MPEPVHACTATSWWRNSLGMVASCTGVAVSKPCAPSASSVAALSGGSKASKRDARESAATGTAAFELRGLAATVAPLVAAAEGALPCGFFLFLKVPRKALAAGEQLSVDVFSFLDGADAPIPHHRALDGHQPGCIPRTLRAGVKQLEGMRALQTAAVCSSS